MWWRRSFEDLSLLRATLQCWDSSHQRTQLEARAYSAFMLGNVGLEREQWHSALAAFKTCHTLCTELARVSLAEHAHLYRKMVSEVEPSMRFCSYNLRREGGGAADDGEEDALVADAETTSDFLRSKLEQVLQETRAKQASHLTELEVLGERVPVRSEKTRVGIVSIQKLLLEVSQQPSGASAAADDAADTDAEDIMGLYDKLFVAFNDSLDSVRADLRAASKEHSTNATLEVLTRVWYWL